MKHPGGLSNAVVQVWTGMKLRTGLGATATINLYEGQRITISPGSFVRCHANDGIHTEPAGRRFDLRIELKIPE